MTLFRNTFRVESTRLRGWDYSTGWYFVTLCTYGRRCCLSEVIETQLRLSEMGRVAEEDLSQLANHYTNVRLDCSVVMPNHVHAIVVIEGLHRYSPEPCLLPERKDPSEFPDRYPRAGSLSSVIRSYKAGVTRRCRQVGLEFAWQSGFYEHIIRSNASLEAIREYIHDNPRNSVADEDNPFRRTGG